MSTTTGALDGVKIVDLGIITAGGASSMALADFGADVVKIESRTYIDPFRQWTQIEASGNAGEDLNQSPPFQAVARNKRALAVDLKDPKGVAVFLELVAEADIVVENFRRGVLERLGIGFDRLRQVNPTVVLLSLSSQGLDGPESQFISFGSPLEGMGGSMAITGYETGAPMWSGNNLNYPDQLVSYFAPGVALAALRQARRDCEAIHVDFAQREAVTYVVGETLVSASLTGTAPAPQGNRDPKYVPQGVYPAKGTDAWIALSIEDDQQWAALAEELDLLMPEAWDSAVKRAADHDRIDAAIERVTKGRDKEELARRLQERGVPASAVRHPAEVLKDPQLNVLGMHQKVPQDSITHRGFAARLSRTPGNIRMRAPRLGEHSREILTEWLGYSDERINFLVSSGAVFEDK